MIEEYHFGSITINGEIYQQDIAIDWLGRISDWQRQEGHVVDIEDVRRAVEQNPETIIIGTGEAGSAKVTDQAQKFVKENGIRLIMDLTEPATRTFNIRKEESEEEEGRPEKIIGLFHLTC